MQSVSCDSFSRIHLESHIVHARLRAAMLCLAMLCLAMLTTVVFAPAGAASEPPGATPQFRAADLQDQIHTLDRTLRRELEKTRQNGVRSEDLKAYVEHIRQDFIHLEGDLRQLGETALLVKLGHLEGLLDNLARSVELGTPAPRRCKAQARPVAPLQGGPLNDACVDAQTVVLGDAVVGTTVGASQDGTASCGGSLASPDVWYRYVPTTSGDVSIDTIGSDFDTVVSVHEACPGTISNEMECDDDSSGLQSAVDFYAVQGQEYLIRVSGFNGATGNVSLQLGEGAEVNGRVTDGVGGTALSFGYVELFDQDGYYVRSEYLYPSQNGFYQFGGIPAGTYFALASSFSGFSNQLWDRIPCWNCFATEGAPIHVQSTGAVENIDFPLLQPGSISGSVVETVTGTPLWGLVRFQDVEDRISAAIWTSDGAFSFQVPAGDYYVWTDSSSHQNQLWEGIACPQDCDLDEGTLISLGPGGDVSGIDFELSLGGAISGTVTDLSGAPIQGIRVEVYDSQDRQVAADDSDAAGFWFVRGLETGTYRARTDEFSLIKNEVWDDIPCTPSCDLSAATPIAVVFDEITPNIDFALSIQGTVSGTVVDLAGEPLSNMIVNIYDADGYYEGRVYTDAFGFYETFPLGSGDYFIRTDSFFHLNEVWDDVACSGCDVDMVGTPISVMNDTQTAGIDFSLQELGGITGRVVRESTGDPVGSIQVEVYNSVGNYIAADYTDNDGVWEVAGLEAGIYFARTDRSGWVDQLYQEIVCHPSCDVTTGTPINVVAETTTSGIDFEIERLSEISGYVRDETSGDGIHPATVTAWDKHGEIADFDQTGYSSGYYSLDLPPGTYFLLVEADFYADELWMEIPCTETCDPLSGTPIVLDADSSPTINFDLEATAGGISGAVLSQVSGAGIGDAEVEFYAEDGTFVASVETGHSGGYSFFGLPQGIYYAVAKRSGWTSEVYYELPCETTCDPTLGTRIAVINGSTNEDVDFTLGGRGLISGVVSAQDTGQLLDSDLGIYDENGNYLFGTYSYGGDYTLTLQPGVYFIKASTYYGDYAAEVYQNIPCSPCDVTTGTPVVVLPDVALTGIDFELDRLGKISGIVVDQETGAPLSGIQVEIWDSNNEYAESETTNFAGVYETDGLPPGVYYAVTDEHGFYLDELWDDIPCLFGPGDGCTPDKGNPIEVALNTTTRHINFELKSFPSGILGTVLDDAGQPLSLVAVDLWSENGTHLRTEFTGLDGTWALSASPGAYYVTTDNGDGWIDQIWQGVRCPQGSAYSGDCDPMTGMQIVVPSTDPFVQGIDFVLDRRIFSDGFEAGTLDAWTTSVP